MKPSVLLFSLIFIPRFLFAQCPEVTVGALQAIEKAEPSEKHAKILAHGFDLTATGATTQRYNRCWLTTSSTGKAYYEQIIVLRSTTNDLTFLTSNESNFEHLQQAIEERHSNSGTIVVGKMFQYQFIEQNLDGIPYSGVIVSLRTQH